MVLLVSVLVYAVSFLLLQALSRYREYAADRGSAVLTGRPSALASALMKISGTIDGSRARTCARRRRDERLLHRPARTKTVAGTSSPTHPPLEKRLAALSRLESQLQSAALTWACGTS